MSARRPGFRPSFFTRELSAIWIISIPTQQTKTTSSTGYHTRSTGGRQAQQPGHQRQHRLGAGGVEVLGGAHGHGASGAAAYLLAHLAALSGGEGGEGAPQQRQQRRERIGRQACYPGVEHLPERLVVQK